MGVYEHLSLTKEMELGVDTGVGAKVRTGALVSLQAGIKEKDICRMYKRDKNLDRKKNFFP